MIHLPPSFDHSYRSLFTWSFGTYLIFGPLLSFMRDATLHIQTLSHLSPIAFLFIFSSAICFFLFLYLAYMSFYLFYDRGRLIIVTGIGVSLILPIGIRFFLDQIFSAWLFGKTNYTPETSFSYYFADNTYYAVYYIPSGILYYFYRRTLAMQAARLEVETLRNEVEMAHLRSQINPHFLFNSLNNIYALAYDKSDKILGAIEGLSGLLRYALYEKSEKVALHKEWDQVQNLICIEQLRLEHPAAFDVDVPEDVMHIAIPPVVLLPLVENIFKHGEVHDPTSPPSIQLWREADYLKVQVKNKKSTTKQRDENSGIGLINIKKRLTYIYGEKAILEYATIEDIFTVNITLPIYDQMHSDR